MKKGLLLSIVASTMIFAGGDIAPVEPAAAAPAADCSDFYGSVGAYYQTVENVKAEDGGKQDDMFGEGNSNFSVTAVIGVEKTLFGGIGFHAEVAGASRVSNDIAMNNRVGLNEKEDGELSQLYLTASFANTAVEVGRFAIPGSLSPLLRTGKTAGVRDVTYDGVLVANTDLADTTIYGVWVYRAGNDSTFNKVGVDAAGDATGAFALGFQNKSIANTTITAVGYYGPDFSNGKNLTVGHDTTAGALTVKTKFGAYGVDAQVTYVDGDTDGLDATMTAGVKIKGSFDMFDAWVAAAYINDGDFDTALAGGHGSILGDAIDASTALVGGVATTAVGGGLSAKVGFGKLYAGAGYQTADNANNTERTYAVVGYKAKVSGIGLKAEYKFWNVSDDAGLDADNSRVRLEAVYSF